jgi:hypothetical protein
MRIDRVQEAGARNAICSAFSYKPRRILRATITTDYVIACTSGIVRVVDSILRVIENIESLRAEFQIAGFTRLEMLQERQVKIQTAGIIQEIPASVTEGKSAGSHKLGRIP